jgi:hypothetical protein
MPGRLRPSVTAVAPPRPAPGPRCRAGLGTPAEHALISLLALNGLRVSEATGADIQALGVERGHRTLVITRKGGKVVTIPLAPRTARAIDLAIGERCDGAVFVARDGRRLDRHGAARIVRRVARRAMIDKIIGPHTLRHAFITAALDAGVPLRDVQEAASHADPRTTMRYDNPRVLHQAGEVCEFCPGNQGVQRRADAPFRSFMTWDYAIASPPDARSARYPGKFMRAGRPLWSRPVCPRSARAYGTYRRVRRPDSLEEHQRGDATGRPGLIG